MRTQTSRTNGGAVGNPQKAVLPNFIIKYVCRYPDYKTILDFGCGKQPVHAEYIAYYTGKQVDAADLSYNTDLLNTVSASKGPIYDIVYASNVINVQENHKQLVKTISTLWQISQKGSVVFFSYPVSPRKMGLTPRQLRARINDIGAKTIYMNHIFPNYINPKTTTAIYQLI